MKKLACLLTTALMLTVCTGVFAAQPAAGTVLNSNPAFDDGIDGWTKTVGAAPRFLPTPVGWTEQNAARSL